MKWQIVSISTLCTIGSTIASRSRSKYPAYRTRTRCCYNQLGRVIISAVRITVQERPRSPIKPGAQQPTTETSPLQITRLQNMFGNHKHGNARDIKKDVDTDGFKVVKPLQIEYT